MPDGVETLDAARPALEDLRLRDDAGNDLPFLIVRPVPAGQVICREGEYTADFYVLLSGLIGVYKADASAGELLAQAWTAQDFGMFSMILTFWFVGRSIERYQK